MTVTEIMTKFPKTLGPEANIHAAAQLMRDNDIGAIPITDDVGSLVGIVTDRDIVIQAIAEGHGLDTPVSKCMTEAPDAIDPTMPVADVMFLMSTKQLRRIPVVEYGRLVGIISLGDLANRIPGEEANKSKTLQDISLSGEESEATTGYIG